MQMVRDAEDLCFGLSDTEPTKILAPGLLSCIEVFIVMILERFNSKL